MASMRAEARVVTREWTALPSRSARAPSCRHGTPLLGNPDPALSLCPHSEPMVLGLLWNLEHQDLKPGNRGGEGRPGLGLGPRVLGAAATQS